MFQALSSFSHKIEKNEQNQNFKKNSYIQVVFIFIMVLRHDSNTSTLYVFKTMLCNLKTKVSNIYDAY